MEQEKNTNGTPEKKKDNDGNYGLTGKGISSEQIENTELQENRLEDEAGKKEDLSPSNSDIDPSITKKGNFSVQESNLDDFGKARYDQKIEDVKAGGDIGEGRASGADRA